MRCTCVRSPRSPTYLSFTRSLCSPKARLDCATSTHAPNSLFLLVLSLIDVDALPNSAFDRVQAMPTLRHLGDIHADLGIPSSAHDKITEA